MIYYKKKCYYYDVLQKKCYFLCIIFYFEKKTDIQENERIKQTLRL